MAHNETEVKVVSVDDPEEVERLLLVAAREARELYSKSFVADWWEVNCEIHRIANRVRNLVNGGAR